MEDNNNIIVAKKISIMLGVDICYIIRNRAIQK